MAQIDKPNLHFNSVLWDGNNSSTTHTVGFQPDFCWIKQREDDGYSHMLFDAIRGATKYISSNESNAEATGSQDLTAFTGTGFTVGTSNLVNRSGDTYVGWNWKAGTGQGSSNTDGSINTTYTSVNTTAGISISKYSGTGSNATVGHGLGAVPKFMMIKETNGTRNWRVYHHDVGNAAVMYLNTNSGSVGDSTAFNSTTPTSSVFSVGTSGGTNASGSTYIAYVFAEKKGFSKFGEWTANNSTDGPFLYTGFKPAFFIAKRTGSTGNWHIYDNKRDGYNVRNWRLAADNGAVEDLGTASYIDILSNGIKIRSNQNSLNNHTGGMVYMAFAENPIVGSNNIPAVGR
jgi:hypothetical protein